MSCSGKVRSTRASPSTSPARVKWPTPRVEQDHLRDRQADRGLEVGRLRPASPLGLSGADSPRWPKNIAVAASAPRADTAIQFRRMVPPIDQMCEEGSCPVPTGSAFPCETIGG